MKRFCRIGSTILGLALIGSQAKAQQATPAPTPKPDYRLFLIGNSLTDQIYWGKFEEMAKSGGRNILIGSQRVPGAPIGWFVLHPDGGFQGGDFGPWKKALVENTWDGLSLQPFQWGYDENIRDIPVILNEFYKKSPQGQLFIYAQWPSFDKGGDWTRRWLEPRSENIMSRAEYDDTVTWLRANVKDRKPARLVPVGHVMHLLEQKAKAGLVPGVPTMWKFYDDGVHLNNVGSFVVATTFYATTQARSPVGLDFKPYADGKMKLSPELAKVIQETVWQMVATHPMTGVSSTRLPEIATPILSPAVQNTQYRSEIFAAFGKAPRVFKIKTGKLPTGMKLSTEGILSGSTPTVGEAKFEVQVTDANGKSASRALTLKVLADSAPKILVNTLPPLQQGRYTRIALKAQSDNAPLFWKVEKGDLPKGMHFNDGGILEGTPGQSGPLDITLAVTDGDDKDPETTSKTFKQNIVPAGKETFFARRVSWKPDVNGKLDAHEKWNLKEPLTKVLSGKPNDSAPMIDIVYDDEKIYIAVMVKDNTLVGGEWELKPNDDQVIIYVDGKNNREKTYNWDDFRLNSGANGSRSNIRGGWWANSNVSKVEGGYLVEAHLNWSSTDQFLIGDNRDWHTIGVDVHVIDNDTEGGETASRVAWHGTLKNDTDPSGYRAVISQP